MVRMTVAQRRTLLVDAAITVMARDGVAHATTRSIVAEAGMQVGAFHYCFFSRDELVVEVIRTITGRNFEAIAAATRTAPEGPEVLDHVAEAYVSHLSSDPHATLLGWELALYALRNPSLREAAAGHLDANVAQVTDVLTLLAQRGGFTWQRPLPELSRLVLAVVDGLSYQYVVVRDTGVLHRLFEELVGLLRWEAGLARGTPSLAGCPERPR